MNQNEIRFPDLMIDVETLSLHYTRAQLLSIGIVAFDPDGTADQIQALAHCRFDTEQTYGIHELSTLDWWMDYPERFRAIRALPKMPPLMNGNSMMSVTSSSDWLCRLLQTHRKQHPKGCVWACGAGFDLTNIWNEISAEDHHKKSWASTYYWRDMRTLREAFPKDVRDDLRMMQEKNPRPHEAFADVWMQAMLVQLMRGMIAQRETSINYNIPRYEGVYCDEPWDGAHEPLP